MSADAAPGTPDAALNELRTGDWVTYRGRRYVVFDTSRPTVVLHDLQRQVYVNAAPEEIGVEPATRRRLRALRRLLDGRGRNLV
jgi:NMD protein affecting ribosome stability and mRNA decay